MLSRNAHRLFEHKYKSFACRGSFHSLSPRLSIRIRHDGGGLLFEIRVLPKDKSKKMK